MLFFTTIDTDRYVNNTLDFDFLLFELQNTIKWLTLDKTMLTARLQHSVGLELTGLSVFI